jgi:hypothetical protein
MVYVEGWDDQLSGKEGEARGEREREKNRPRKTEE